MTSLPANILKGSLIEIQHVPHVFDRVDPDSRVTLRGPDGTDYMVVELSTGAAVKPTIDQLLQFLAEGIAIVRSDPVSDPNGQRSRVAHLDAHAAKTLDPKCEIRAWFGRAYDVAPCSKGNIPLLAWRDQLIADNPRLADLIHQHLKRLPRASTLRGWIRRRGRPGERRMRDFVDLRGKVKRRRRLAPVVLEILQRHALQDHTRHAMPIKGSYARFVWELDRVNGGVPTGPDLPDYDAPDEPYPIPTYQTFRQEVRRTECSETWRAKHGDQAVYSRWRGGGRSRMPTRIGALAVQDDTRLPMIFLVDTEHGIPVGEPLLTIQMDMATRCITGWDLDYDEPSTATMLRTVLHAGTPKKVPEDMAERYPVLRTIYCRPDGLLMDNASPHHSHSAEDSLADVGITCIYAGADMPRDKALGERAILTVIQIFLSALPGRTYEIPRAREFGYDPEKHAMLTIEEARALLARAIAVYHVASSRALMGRQPALVWSKQAALHGINVLADPDEFARSIGEVEYDQKLTKSGVTVNNLRYSDFRLTPALLDDLVGLEPPSKRRTKNPTVTVKIRVDPSDLGQVHVWNRRTKRYVTLPCDNPDYAAGMPLWLHRRIRQFAQDEALAFNTPIEQAAARAQFVELATDVVPEFRQREKRLVGRLMGIKQIRRLLGEDVEVDDERIDEAAIPEFPEEFDNIVPHDLAAPHRLDAETPGPRAAKDTTPPKRRSPRRASPEIRDRRDTPRGRKVAREHQPPKRRSGGGVRWGDSFD